MFIVYIWYWLGPIYSAVSEKVLKLTLELDRLDVVDEAGEEGVDVARTAGVGGGSGPALAA